MKNWLIKICRFVLAFNWTPFLWLLLCLFCAAVSVSVSAPDDPGLSLVAGAFYGMFLFSFVMFLWSLFKACLPRITD